MKLLPAEQSTSFCAQNTTEGNLRRASRGGVPNWTNSQSGAWVGIIAAQEVVLQSWTRYHHDVRTKLVSASSHYLHRLTSPPLPPNSWQKDLQAKRRGVAK